MEVVCGGNVTVGSNPTLSANFHPPAGSAGVRVALSEPHSGESNGPKRSSQQERAPTTLLRFYGGRPSYVVPGPDGGGAAISICLTRNDLVPNRSSFTCSWNS